MILVLGLIHLVYTFRGDKLGLVLLLGYAFLGQRCWFSVPFRGIVLATALYVAALIARWA